MKRLVALILLLPALSQAQTHLPVRVGFYSSADCSDPPNASLLHFDGKNLTGAHSAACVDDTVQIAAHRFRLKQRCPAQQVGQAVPATATSQLRIVSINQDASFDLLGNASGSRDPIHYHLCKNL
ncbi:hypothetical protein [Rhodanobacter sp. L36]|uniref:hypothetical protein n=1 Tax=Rhodanobacter sp. L36 TaxID=1747221 RepID=UPI00131E0375|nr:hypothetical protein [Rhodanobacter sp. L36]